MDITPLSYCTPLVCCALIEVAWKLCGNDKITLSCGKVEGVPANINNNGLVSKKLHNHDPESQAYLFPPTMTCPFTCFEMRQGKTCALGNRFWWQDTMIGCCVVSVIFAVWPLGSPKHRTNLWHCVVPIWNSDYRERQKTNKKQCHLKTV